MKLIVGLGNPGHEYELTRHNVGFMVVDAFASKNSKTPKLKNSKQSKDFKFEKIFNAEILKMEELIFAKPVTFMNNSGLAVKKLTTKFQIPTTDLYVIHDDLDIRLGEYKIDFAKGPKLHNGIKSIEEHLKTDQFWRVRIGVDNRAQKINAKDQMLNEKRMPGERYVLERFSEEEQEIVVSVLQAIQSDLLL